MPPVGPNHRSSQLNSLFSRDVKLPGWSASSFKWPVEEPVGLLAPFPLGTAPNTPDLGLSPYINPEVHLPVPPTPPRPRAPPGSPQLYPLLGVPLIDWRSVLGTTRYLPNGLLDLNLLSSQPDLSSSSMSTLVSSGTPTTASFGLGRPSPETSSDFGEVPVPSSRESGPVPGNPSRPEPRVYDLSSGKTSPVPASSGLFNLGIGKLSLPHLNLRGSLGVDSSANSKSVPLSPGSPRKRGLEVESEYHQTNPDVSVMQVGLLVLVVFGILLSVRRVLAARSRKRLLS